MNVMNRFLPWLLLALFSACGGNDTGCCADPDPTPTAIAPQAGASQSGTVNSAVAVAPAVRITTRSGAPAGGVAVSFEVIHGGGSVTGASTRTNADGVAAVGSWTLGNTVGEQRLAARSAGLPEVSFSAMASPAPGTGVLERSTGSDGQTATTGTAVAVVPAVRVRDAAGAPLAGVVVGFAVTAGGGSVVNASAVSDATGLTSAGGWTLGSAAGTHTLQASATGFAPATFNATALGTGAPTFTRSVWLSGLAAPGTWPSRLTAPCCSPSAAAA